MNRDILETQWPQIRDILHEKFSNLTDEDIRQINGQYDRLVAKLQQKYGYSREEAEERIRSWNFDRFANMPKGQAHENRAYHEDRVRRDEGSSFLPWLLALCLPLLLLAAYFYGPARTDNVNTTTAPATTEERVVDGTPADRMLSNNLRNALVSQGVMMSDLRNVQITSNNGVVTLSGTVASDQTRDSIENIAEDFSGVREVINNIRVQSP